MPLAPTADLVLCNGKQLQQQLTKAPQMIRHPACFAVSVSQHHRMQTMARARVLAANNPVLTRPIEQSLSNDTWGSSQPHSAPYEALNVAL
jgi:hypothetical protein